MVGGDKMLVTIVFSFPCSVFRGNLSSSHKTMSRPGGSVVSVSDPLPAGCELDTQLRGTFIPAYFRLSPLLKYVRKVVGGFGKKVVLVLV